jgi:3-hydroxyisobutyrate dehydrogenase-like beta-hydroxyacid dehydrogenase
MPTTIGLIGLGNAGRPIGERILARGYTLTVYDLNPATMENMVRRGACAASSAQEVVSDITLTVLPSSIEVRQAVFGNAGAFAGAKPGMTFIDLSGTDPDCARELQSRLEEKQAAFLGGTIHASGAPAIVIPQGQFTIAVGVSERSLTAASVF